MKFGFIRNVTTDIVVVRVISPRGLVGGYQHFGGGNSAFVFRLKIQTLCSTETPDNAKMVISCINLLKPSGFFAYHQV